MAMRTLEIPVLIVGGGASGMGLANDLGYRGVPCMVIEQGTGEIKTPKTGHISARTMEHCRRWGFVEEVRDAGFPRDYPLDTVICTSLSGYVIGRKATPSINDTRPLPTSPENRIRCPQMWFDPLLARKAQERSSVTVHYQWRFDGFEGDPETGMKRVAVTDLVSNEKVAIECRYLVGADGANSRVRHSLGFGMSGKPLLNYSLIVLFECPRFFEYHDKGRAERYTFIRADGWGGNITVVNGTNLWRLSLRGQDHHYDLETFDARAAVLEAFGRDDVEFDVKQVAPWKRTELVADHFAKDGVFLTGDAAHTMSPTGGFGMNTAVDDSVNLGWKLWAAVEGWGGSQLLDSYEDERRAVAFRNCRMASENFHLWVEATRWDGIEDDGPEGDRVRTEAARSFDTVTDRIQGSEGVILGYRYEGSPVCIPDGSPAPPDEYATYVPTCRPGSRAPHVWLNEGTSTLDLFGKAFVAFYSNEGKTAAQLLEHSARHRGIPFESHPIESPELANLYDRDLVLVRPDGHVAYAATPPITNPDEANTILATATGA